MPACFCQAKLQLSVRCARNSGSDSDISAKAWDTSWLGNLAAKCWKHPNMSQTQHKRGWFTAFPAARACFHRNSFGLLPGFMSPLYTSGTLCRGIREKHVETGFISHLQQLYTGSDQEMWLNYSWSVEHFLLVGQYSLFSFKEMHWSYTAYHIFRIN